MILAAASCTKPTVEEPEAKAKLTLAENQETSFTVEHDGEVISINFNSTLDWSSEISLNTEEEWLKFIPASGKGGDIKGKVQIEKNTTSKERKAELTITSQDQKLTFAFTQKAKKSDDTDNDDDDDGDDDNGDENGDNGDNGQEEGGDNGEGGNEEELPDQNMPEIPADPEVSSISSMLEGGIGTVSQGTHIMGYVISNRELGNLTSLKNMYIQDETAGVMIRFAEDHTYNYGDLLKIDVSGLSLEYYNNATQLNNVPQSNVEVVSTKKSIPYKTISMSDFLANKYESRYVALKNVQVCESDMNKTWVSSGAHTSINFEDGNGNKFVVFSSKFATYGNETVPSGSGTLKGIASINNGNIQLIFSTSDDWADMTGNRLGEESGDDSGSGSDGGEQPGGDNSDEGSQTPAVNQNWLELPALSSDSNYLVNTYYDGNNNRNYTHLYDKSTYTSLWTAYPLNSSHIGSGRSDDWSFNPKIDTKYQVDLTGHSYNDNYSRGHMIPNGSRNGNSTMQSQTFYVTNSVPQIQNNFNGGIWMHLENELQSIGKSEEIYIVTGVSFNKVGENKIIKYTTAKDDNKQVPVPNYFWKVVLKVNKSGDTITSASTIGFWFDHKTYTDSYSNYSQSVDQIEEWTGFDFFVNLPDKIESSAESNKSWSSFKSF